MSEGANVLSLHELDVGQMSNHSVNAPDALLLPILMTYKESKSSYASPIVIVRKMNREVRMYIDYQTLMSLTVPHHYATACIDEVLDFLSGSKWFSVFDLHSCNYQIAMKEEDKDKTAFFCPLGLYQFERTPQGITPTTDGKGGW